MNRVLVTGAAQNIGASICRTLAEEGYSLVIHYRHSESEAEALAVECQQRGVEVEMLAGDFSTPEGVEAFIQRYQKRYTSTYALINNVGNYVESSPLEISQQMWTSLFQTNVCAPSALCQALAPALRSQQGRIINLGCAGLGRQLAKIHCAAYTATKDALWRLTSSLAWELAKEGVTVNMVSPGHTESSVSPPSSMQQIPMGRLASGEDIAQTIAFLLSERASYVTGQNIEVAGGFQLR